MPDGMDWLLRPVRRGMCLYESLLDGRLDLDDVALMNDALDVEDYNRRLANRLANREQ